MHKLLWAVLLVLACGCNQAPSLEEAEPKPSVAEFALQPESKEASDIRTAYEADKKKINEIAQWDPWADNSAWLDRAVISEKEEDDIDLSDNSLSLEKKLRGLLGQLYAQQDVLFESVWFDLLPGSLTREQSEKLSSEILLAAQARKNDWQKAESVWSAQPKEILFAPRLAPASLWNKREVLSCANKIYQWLGALRSYQEEETNQGNKQPKPLLQPEPFLKEIELKLAQKEEWKQAQKAVWDKWVQQAPVQEQYQVFELIAKKIIDASDWESSWQENFTGSAFRPSGKQGAGCLSEGVNEMEKIEFLYQLLLSLPKPWKQTDNSFTICEEVVGEECVRGAKSVSWRRVKEDVFSRFEVTTVSCQKGFFENGDCRLGYNRVTNGAGTRTNVSCDTYFNGKCYGEFNSSVVDTDKRCYPEDSTEVRIKKSDFDGSWGYTQSSYGCGDEEYDIWCYRFDPKTLVCQDGFYQEQTTCRANNSVYDTYWEGCVPDEDILSCEIKDGVCVNEKIIEGRRRGNKKGNLWTVLEAEEGKSSDSEKKKEFRLTLPKEYAFE